MNPGEGRRGSRKFGKNPEIARKTGFIAGRGGVGLTANARFQERIFQIGVKSFEARCMPLTHAGLVGGGIGCKLRSQEWRQDLAAGVLKECKRGLDPDIAFA